MIKKLVLLMLVLAFFATPVFAASSRYGLQVSDAVEENTALVLPAGTWVYGLTIFADAASSFMGIYDSATLWNCTNATMVKEIGEATQYDSCDYMFPKPVYFTNGVSIVISVGVGQVFYGAQP